MKIVKSSRKKVRKFLIKNILLSSFIAIVAIVGFVVVFRMLTAQPEYIYAKIKVSQGLWWANTTKPSIWLAESIQKGDVEKSLAGKPVVEVLEVRRYPWWGSDEFLVYITAKLEVSKNKKIKRYTFKRSMIGVGSPIDLELSNAQISGTIVSLSDEPFPHNESKKEVTFIKKWAEPWEFDAIQVGDKYNNGEEDIFEILDKKVAYANTEYFAKSGNNYPIYSEQKVHITITASVSVREENNTIIFGEDQILRLGKEVNLSTEKYTFIDYLISEIR